MIKMIKPFISSATRFLSVVTLPRIAIGVSKVCVVILYFFALLLQMACGSPRGQVPQGMATSKDKQILQDVNRYLSEKEQDVLVAYIARQRLDMTQAPSGYYYQVVHQGKGVTIGNEYAVRLYGRIMLLDGTVCYTYSQQCPLELVVGAHADIKILNTALLGMQEGSVVRFVFPSYMAYGLLGDGDKIPPSSPLVCEFTIAKVVEQ